MFVEPSQKVQPHPSTMKWATICAQKYSINVGVV